MARLGKCFYCVYLGFTFSRCCRILTILLLQVLCRDHVAVPVEVRKFPLSMFFLNVPQDFVSVENNKANVCTECEKSCKNDQTTVEIVLALFTCIFLSCSSPLVCVSLSRTLLQAFIMSLLDSFLVLLTFKFCRMLLCTPYYLTRLIPHSPLARRTAVFYCLCHSLVQLNINSGWFENSYVVRRETPKGGKNSVKNCWKKCWQSQATRVAGLNLVHAWSGYLSVC